jgi:enoyl-CoA hydratase
MSDPVLVEHDGDIVTVVLNRPEKRNALNKAMWTGVGSAMTRLSDDDGIRCVVIRGAGGTFSPGADIAEFESVRADSRQAAEYGRLMHATMRAVGACRHPTVALIEGVCVGGGLELATMADIRICGDSSRFGVPINRIGVVMAYPEVSALLGLVGRAATLEILFEGRVFGASEAKDKGLVNRAVPDDRVEQEAYECARRIADGAPLVNRWHKAFVNRLQDPKPISDTEAQECYATFDTEDFNRGFRAFLRKEKPEFIGR